MKQSHNEFMDWAWNQASSGSAVVHQPHDWASSLSPTLCALAPSALPAYETPANCSATRPNPDYLAVTDNDYFMGGGSKQNEEEEGSTGQTQQQPACNDVDSAWLYHASMPDGYSFKALMNRLQATERSLIDETVDRLTVQVRPLSLSLCLPSTNNDDGDGPDQLPPHGPEHHV